MPSPGTSCHAAETLCSSASADIGIVSPRADAPAEVAAALTAFGKLPAPAGMRFRVVVHLGTVAIGGAPSLGEESLLLLKPTLEVAHGGGKRFAADSPAFALIRLWLEQGAPGPAKEDPAVLGVRVYPETRLMEIDQGQK